MCGDRNNPEDLRQASAVGGARSYRVRISGGRLHMDRTLPAVRPAPRGHPPRSRGQLPARTARAVCALVRRACHRPCGARRPSRAAPPHRDPRAIEGVRLDHGEGEIALSRTDRPPGGHVRHCRARLACLADGSRSGEQASPADGCRGARRRLGYLLGGCPQPRRSRPRPGLLLRLALAAPPALGRALLLRELLRHRSSALAPLAGVGGQRARCGAGRLGARIVLVRR